jgi:hypothetical protein
MDKDTLEKLGPAERIIRTMTPFVDHVVHHRTGIVCPDGSPVGFSWRYAKYFQHADANAHVQKEGERFWAGDPGRKVVCLITSKHKHDVFTPIGVLEADGKTVKDGARVVGEYRKPGFFVEVAAWLYKQVAQVWRIDNEFAARWASYAYRDKHEDMKVILAAFLLVQSRSGAPVTSDGALAFYDEDLREVGEAMLLRDDEFFMNAKLVDRVHQLLRLPAIAQINREMGFGKSDRRSVAGRWDKVVHKWLRYREQNPRMFKGMVSAGWRQTVIKLASESRYVPVTPHFFYGTLGWRQVQAKDGRRQLHIGGAVAQAESWQGLSEEQVCEKITADRPGWNRLAGLLPASVGMTKAVMAAAIDAGCLSDREMVNLAPTIEELGLLGVPTYRERLDKALAAATNMRAANLALRMKTKEGQDKLQQAADTAMQKDMAEAVRQLVLYFFIDISGSMKVAIERAKQIIGRLLGGFPLDKIAVVVFRESARIVTIRHASKAGVDNAFLGIEAEGGTNHASAVVCGTAARKPGPGEDAIFMWFGDGGERDYTPLVKAVGGCGVQPVAFGFLEMTGPQCQNWGCVRSAAAALNLPLFDIDERIFGASDTETIDPYAVARSMRAIIAAAPVGAARAAAAPAEKTLIDKIATTELLQLPPWAVTPRAVKKVATSAPARSEPQLAGA